MAISPLAALSGLQRAMARGAPAGYEYSSVWNSSEIPDMMTYKLREKDRQQEAYQREMDAWRENPVGIPPQIPGARTSPGWEGFNEGLNYNDVIAAAGPDAKHKVVGLTSSLPTHTEKIGSIADDPKSSFNTISGPFGQFGVGTGGVQPTGLSTSGMDPISQEVEETRRQAEEKRRNRALAGLNKAGY